MSELAQHPVLVPTGSSERIVGDLSVREDGRGAGGKRRPSVWLRCLDY